MTPRPRTSATAVASRLAIVAMAATLLVACSSGDDESADDSTTTTTPTTQPAAGEPSTTVAGGGDPATSSGTAPAALKPPDTDSPVAPMCNQADGEVVEVVYTPDLIPSPRCVKVTADQRLQVRNDTDQPQDASIAHHSVTLAPGETALFDQPVGEYLQPGIHHGPLGAEIWLQP